MKAMVCLLVFLSFFSSLYGQTPSTLYLVNHGSLWGYIDSSGTVVVPPRFHAADRFSEGLAAVRSGGTYGYIDATGSFAIPPRFDYALPFRNGVAKAYIDSIPFFIDTKGNVLFRFDTDTFHETGDFNHKGLAVVITKSDRQGMIDREGKIVVDTMFKEIGWFHRGLAIVEGISHAPYDDIPVYEQGIINASGKWVVPFGIYSLIYSRPDGSADVIPIEKPPTEEWREHVIDAHGMLRTRAMAQPNDNYYYPCFISAELAVVRIPLPGSVNKAEQPDEQTSSDKEPSDEKSWDAEYDPYAATYVGLVNSSGALVLSDTSWTDMRILSEKLLFVKGADKWILIDTKGRRVVEHDFDELGGTMLDFEEPVVEYGRDSLVVVRMGDSYGVLDTTGQFVAGPRRFGSDIGSIIREGDVVLLNTIVRDKPCEPCLRVGFWNIRTDAVVEPVFDRIEIANAGDDLIAVVRDGKRGYVNRQGRIVWSETPSEMNNAVNIDFMVRGYCRASSPYKKELAGAEGWARSSNAAKQLSSAVKVEGKKLQLVLDPQQEGNIRQEGNIGQGYAGMALYLANTAADTMYLEVEDSRLHLTMQALDKNGIWRDIEYLSNSWCAHSYHKLFLAPGQYWEFTVPQYTGELKTRLRAQLVCKKGSDGRKEQVLYSNEIEGGVNPGQFWRKPEYQPAGIMDPYNE